ncbi:hypothetical protein [Aeromonas hydrophila]|uniref:hypothetical protein n=1 Tax=Aeromonas hydrophila TaxID=644 RepID=UPI002B462BB7|nr:hypothetical protein [Aeromonas hydrophila]
MGNWIIFRGRLETSLEVVRKTLLVTILFYMAALVIRMMFDSVPGSLFTSELLVVSTSLNYLCAALATAWLAIDMLGVAVDFKIKAASRQG